MVFDHHPPYYLRHLTLLQKGCLSGCLIQAGLHAAIYQMILCCSRTAV